MKITFDKRELPRTKDAIKRFLQLTVVSENDKSITIEGTKGVVECMLGCLYFYAKRKEKLKSYKVHHYRESLRIHKS